MLLLSYRKTVFCLLVFGSVMFLNSCQKPDTKDEYINRFKNFIERVDKYHEDYTKNDWKWADERFKLYSVDLYDEFKDDLTTEEKIEVFALKLEYRNIEEPDVISDLLNDLKDEEDEIKQKLDEYLEKDFDQDIEKLMDGMLEISDSAVKVIEDIFEKIDNRF